MRQQRFAFRVSSTKLFLKVSIGMVGAQVHGRASKIIKWEYIFKIIKMLWRIRIGRVVER